jgi:hypothetical protein
VKAPAIGFLALASVATGLFVAQLSSRNAWLGAQNFELELENRDLRIAIDALQVELEKESQAFLAGTKVPVEVPQPQTDQSPRAEQAGLQ